MSDSLGQRMPLEEVLPGTVLSVDSFVQLAGRLKYLEALQVSERCQEARSSLAAAEKRLALAEIRFLALEEGEANRARCLPFGGGGSSRSKSMRALADLQTATLDECKLAKAYAARMQANLAAMQALVSGPCVHAGAGKGRSQCRRPPLTPLALLPRRIRSSDRPGPRRAL